MKMGDGVSIRRIAEFPELTLQLLVTIFEPGAVGQLLWDDPSRSLTKQTYFRSHIALTGPFQVRMKFQDGKEDDVTIDLGKAWPHQEIRQGLRQVLVNPIDNKKVGEHFCVLPLNADTHSINYNFLDLEKGQSLTVAPGNLLLVLGKKYLINGVNKASDETGWSITACVKSSAKIHAEESCRVLVYHSVPHFETGKLA